MAALKGLLLGHHASSLDLCRQKPWAGVDGEGALAGGLGVFTEELAGPLELHPHQQLRQGTEPTLNPNFIATQ